MSGSFEDVYRMALKLSPDEQRRLADYLTNPPSALTSSEILARLNAHFDELHRMGVDTIGLFGSYARDEASPGSDIDILVTLREKSLFTGYMRVKLYLEECLGHPVDLVTEEETREELRPHILKEIIYLQGV